MDIVQVRPGTSKPDYNPESEEEVMWAFHNALERCDLERVDWPWVLFETVSNDRHELVKELLDNNYVDANDTMDKPKCAMEVKNEKDYSNPFDLSSYSDRLVG